MHYGATAIYQRYLDTVKPEDIRNWLQQRGQPAGIQLLGSRPRKIDGKQVASREITTGKERFIGNLAFAPLGCCLIFPWETFISTSFTSPPYSVPPSKRHCSKSLQQPCGNGSSRAVLCIGMTSPLTTHATQMCAACHCLACESCSLRHAYGTPRNAGATAGPYAGSRTP